MSSLCCGNLYETAQSALAKNDLKCLNELYSRLLVDVRPMFTNEQLLDRIYDPDHTLCRNFGAEIYVPKHAHDGKTCTAIRSEASGNCLYSSASLVLVGNNALVPTLRILTSLELFIHAAFYAQHPCFLSVISEHSDYFAQSLNNLLPLSVSKECLDTGYTTDELVKQEAILNCNDQKWSSFLCILGLSSVLGRKIHTFYPDSGESRYKLLFNRIVQPRLLSQRGLDAINILFCHEGSVQPGRKLRVWIILKYVI
ncbi:uncharacterized protein LOC124447678 isoform X1 [Xenia sp. Carnegie-2017]|uniref:uncharacterized protein LOC124436859 isoform X1 n=2 Tax=Xenia sp. Carnegie-2017 TaxID=2897299 RepID=UPI001F03A2D4|nr:uncharacterized protein LOC124436859 isoform X1 [Xenia sp. Carnegie-2017]XP_046854603.1 uncharacterized protein LOC124447678 isoform X1 [Xenia sp. Carnegie-2017]